MVLVGAAAVVFQILLNTLRVFTRLVQPVGHRALINLEGHHDGGRGQPKINNVRTSVTTLRSVFNPHSGVPCE